MLNLIRAKELFNGIVKVVESLNLFELTVVLAKMPGEEEEDNETSCKHLIMAAKSEAVKDTKKNVKMISTWFQDWNKTFRILNCVVESDEIFFLNWFNRV